MGKTKIEWCDETINPVLGCSKCSLGCDNCYAERQAARLAKIPKTSKKYAGVVDEHGKWTGKINVDCSCFNKLPRKPNKIFVISFSDGQDVARIGKRRAGRLLDGIEHNAFPRVVTA